MPDLVVLALDSAGAACSAAVAIGETVLSAERIESEYGQAERLLPLVDAAMRRAGLPPAKIDLVAATVGPGSFTGIRVGLAAARGIALATGARLIGVTSFAAAVAGIAPADAAPPNAAPADVPLADEADGHYLLVALESRREDLFVQIFDRAGNPVGAPAAVMPGALGEAVGAMIGAAPLLIAGDAAQRAARALARPTGITMLEQGLPEAIGALRAALRSPPLGNKDTARPFYLRPPDVSFPSGDRKPGFGRA